ncbi:MAG: hypothetical protein CL927_06300 [Deltaproteobacteria bacterium]|nr:hypothetical protein [Deltaproteobacteria bacterium]HCH66268.1 hypothetical protein [Deltaproteobacteria bacterium]
MGLTAGQHAVLNRWEVFLTRLETRSEDLRAEASSELQSLVDSLLAADVVQTRPVYDALSRIEARLHNLPTKIDRAWQHEAAPLFDAEASAEPGSAELLELGIQRRETCKVRLENRVERFKLRWSTALYRQMWSRVEAALQEVALCSECGASLPGIDRRFRTTVSCSPCDSMVVVLPPAVVSTYRTEAPQQFALEAARGIREAIHKHRAEVERLREADPKAPQSFEAFDRREALECQYWECYAKVVTETGWEPAHKASELVTERMEAFASEHTPPEQQ